MEELVHVVLGGLRVDLLGVYSVDPYHKPLICLHVHLHRLTISLLLVPHDPHQRLNNEYAGLIVVLLEVVVDLREGILVDILDSLEVLLLDLLDRHSLLCQFLLFL